MESPALEELKRLLDAFDVALDMSPEQRDDWLATLDTTDPPFGGRLRELLAARDRVETRAFMQEPAWKALPPLPIGDAEDVEPGALASGTEIGGYRLERELGMGGMGAVWLAERADGLIKRPVALKLPHAGPFARAFAERFARERAILADLEHPNIARLYDAGVDARRQPFLALEYVEGERFDQWCDERKLDIAARLRLFLEVLSAVQYAHGRLVVHRDLKPANILVTQDGRVKLLDFGIARLLADTEAESSALTKAGSLALTPDYASPEQITGAPIGVASDVYSLGVVLYELLCGRRPYRLARESRGALEDAIVSVAVQRPSDVDIEPAIAQQRATDPARLRRVLRGDLDTIVLTALAKDPAARYATCSAFADDLQRFLDGRPILARTASRWYLARKFVQRHRWSVGAATAFLVLVSGSALVAAVQAVKAREEATRADTIRRFVVGVFERNRATQADATKARTTTVRELLDLGRDELLAKPPAEPATAEALYATFSEMYLQLGLTADALRLDRLRLEQLRKAFGEVDRRTLEAQFDVALVLMRQVANADEANGLATDLVAKLDRIGDHDSRVRAHAELLLANLLDARHQPDAVVHMQRAVDLWRKRYADDQQFPVTLGSLAMLQVRRGDIAAARASIHEAIDVWSKSPKRTDYEAVNLYNYLGRISEANDELRAAEAAYRRAVELERKNADARAWQAHVNWVYLVRLLARTSPPAGVLDEGPQILAQVAQAGTAPPWFDAWARSALLEAATAADVPAMDTIANDLERGGCAVREPAFVELLCRCALLEFHAVRGNRDATARLVGELEEQRRTLPPQGSGFTANAMWITLLQAVARGHLALGATAKADDAAKEARRQFVQPSAQPFLTDVRLGLVERNVLLAQGDRAGAETLTARLQARLAAHPDRAALASYEKALNTR
jgi:serine/threonine-protein kinase